MKMKKNIFAIVIIGMVLLSSFLSLPVTSSGTDYEAIVNAFRNETVVFDNGMNYVGLFAAQWDETISFDAYPADDFQFDEDTQVNTVKWIGGYFGYNYSQGNFDWNITFYYDVGNGSAPGSIYLGPYTYASGQYNQTFLEDNGYNAIYYEFSVDLPTALTFTANEKYWISIYGVGAVFPQSGWGYNDTIITLHQAVFKSEYFFNVSDWYDTVDVFGTASDMCFQLISTEQNATIINIKDETPADSSVGISINQSFVSVNISAAHVVTIGNLGSLTPIPFNWTIEGQYVQPAGGNGSTAGTKTANLNTPLPYLTEIIWYVNVTANGVQRNEVFSFTTEEPPNQPPIANFSYTINDLTLAFTSTSTDSDGYIANWSWDFGDGNISYENNPMHSYGDNGTYAVTLTVKDNDGAENSTTKDVVVINNYPVANFTYAMVGGTKQVHFDASDSYDINGTIVSYYWEFGDGNTSTEDKVVTHTYEHDYRTYKVNLTVTDSAGLTNTTSQTITFPDMTDPTIKIEKPIRGLYIKDKFVRKFLIRLALIIGDITIKVNASDTGSGIKYVELWIGKELKFNSTTGQFNYTWHRDRLRLIHLFKIKVVAYDNKGNSATKTMIVRKFL